MKDGAFQAALDRLGSVGRLGRTFRTLRTHRAIKAPSRTVSGEVPEEPKASQTKTAVDIHSMHIHHPMASQGMRSLRRYRVWLHVELGLSVALLVLSVWSFTWESLTSRMLLIVALTALTTASTAIKMALDSMPPTSPAGCSPTVTRVKEAV